LSKNKKLLNLEKRRQSVYTIRWVVMVDWVDKPRESTVDASFFFERDRGEKIVIYRVRWYCHIQTESYHFNWVLSIYVMRSHR
jgi:hypothetical protein